MSSIFSTQDAFRLEDNFDIHRPIAEEYIFYQAVAKGDVNTVKLNCEKARFTDEEGVGVLSTNPVTNIKYHFVISTALITRICVQSGMSMEQAYRLSDFFIRKLDNIHTIQEVQDLHDEMSIHYAEQMRRYFHNDTDSKYVNTAKEYIYAHIGERVTIERMADELGLSASYLSRLFKKTTGDSFSHYVRNQKIEVAKDRLRYSDDSMIDITTALAFSSQSHFIQQFKEVVGMTPKKYRDTHYNPEWDSSKEV